MSPKPIIHGRDHASGGADPIPGLTAIAADAEIVPYSISGELEVANGGLRWYAQDDGTVTLVHVSVGTAPTGSGVTVQLNLNGSSIGTVTIAAATNTNTFTPSSPGFSAGDYFTVDVTAIGSTIAGADLVVQVSM